MSNSMKRKTAQQLMKMSEAKINDYLDSCEREMHAQYTRKRHADESYWTLDTPDGDGRSSAQFSSKREMVEWIADFLERFDITPKN